ncbi:hypothetical protein NIES22_45540 [Calothrix brevissima NIES-22]|nr:hypothetical protein NIES22_45540 [Calothrix brevissima NIES-22]
MGIANFRYDEIFESSNQIVRANLSIFINNLD